MVGFKKKQKNKKQKKKRSHTKNLTKNGEYQSSNWEVRRRRRDGERNFEESRLAINP